MKLDKNYKVRVTPEQSREIHSLILLEGGEVSYGLKPQLQDEFLVVENEHDSVVIYYTDQDIFPTIENQEIQADDLITLLTDLPKSAENPPQGMELTPEFETEASEPKFEVGNKVYKYGDTDVKTVLEVFENGYMRISNYPYRVNHETLCHATPKNHAVLSKPFPAIEFEQPAKELKGSDLCRAMLEKGWKYVPCYVHDGSDDEAINRKHYVSVKNETPRSGYNFSGTGANDWKYAVPIDPRTGEPLTEAVLDE